jgi:DNA-binding MarR family transcriptional regulator
MRKGLKSLSPRVPQVGEAMRGEEGHLPYLLSQAHAAMRLALERALADLKVTAPQFSILTMIDSYPGLSGAELARLSMLTPQTINLIVKNLERDGLIAKSPDDVHGRILRLQATAAGRALRKKCRERANRIETRVSAGLAASEEKVVRRWLVQLASEMHARPERA